jgi:poly-gamma-glutamate synthesis protein (capsule biosynthesis protein)
LNRQNSLGRRHFLQLIAACGALVNQTLPSLAIASGQLLNLRLIPFQIRKFRLNRASEEDAAWLRGSLSRESARFGVRVELSEDHTLSVTW